jgi:primosomal protein N' (replication factor Y)
MQNGDGRQVEVAVDALSDRPERTFTYLLGAEHGEVAAGSLVLVPYGRRLALGYLLEVSGRAADVNGAGLKPVEAVVSTPMLPADLIGLAREIATYYRAPLGTTLAAMLPPGLESRLERHWQVERADQLPTALAGEIDAEGLLRDGPLRRAAPDASASAWIERLRRAGAIRARWRLRPPELAPRQIRVVRRLRDGEPPRRAPVQRSLLEALGVGEERPLHELADELGTESAALLGPARRLATAGLVELGWRTVERDPLGHRLRAVPAEHRLADEQQAAWLTIRGLPSGGELLLEGVAASGKTEVYLAALGDALAAGRTGIVLVPELSLVPQLADLIRSLVGDGLAVLHSGLSAGERHDEWWRIVRGDARVVLGTRSAIFAPLSDLGLIVVDEEHDGAYKSDRTPRYDARWVARRRAAATGARLILASATPEVVSLARVRGGHAERARLIERRVGGTPSIRVIDMRAELAGGNRSVLSDPLAEALGALQRGEDQAILLINRRGAATFILCRDCGESLRCPDCDLPFVYHLEGGTLRCHHCGRSAQPPERCPRCASRRIRYFGAGTQRVEAELRSRYPHLRVARMDSDALAVRRGFEAAFDDLREGRVDVVVGTQLAAKGLDLPRVTLAAVVAADVTLNLPDFRAAERTFQLLAQVAGRAGRGARPGQVLIQTYLPEHYAVRAASQLDNDGFADEELGRRRLLGYPPFSLLARLVVADTDRARAEQRAQDAARAASLAGVEVLGPLPAYVARRAGRWRFQVVLRATDAAARSAALERIPPGVSIDVDPASLL